MPGMRDDYEYDAEGDVKMSMPQPIFEVTRAPSLKVWSQASITTFLRERRQYEGKVLEQCRVTGEVQGAVTRSIRSTIEPRVLEHVTHYILKKDAASVTDDMLVAEMKRKVGAMMNDRVPDVTQLFSRELKMDLAEVDVEARIASYFMAFDRLVEDNGLSSMLGRGPAVGEEGRQRVKLRCKLLLTNVTPEILKVDLLRLVELTHREARVNDLALHDLMIERATRQQQYHLMQSEMKQSAAPRIKAAAVPATKATQRPGKPRLQQSGVPGGARKTEEQRKPPRDGCLICKGAHWARDCPTATAEQKAEVVKTLREKRDRQPERVKRITTDGEPTFRSAVINGVLDVPFCPDTGSDANIIGRPVFDELRDLVPSLRIERVEPPSRVVAAGGNVMLCREKVHIDLQIVTAAGPLALSNIPCLVLDAPEEELLLGRATLQSIGVDLDGIFEQLAQQHVGEADAEADDIPVDHVEVVGKPADDEVAEVLHRLVDEAMEAGFDVGSADRLRDLVIGFADVFRLRLGHDEAADVEPLEVRLVPDAQPYRSGVRRYPEAQRQFLRDYVRELEAAGLVERNNHSRWSCPALPVAKQGTNEFRITIDYRPVNKLTVPLAGAAPNLTVVVEAVRGAYGFGTFDFHKGFWQMPLHTRSREMFSFVTEDGVFTPTRVPQGASDSAVHFQAQMNEVLKELLFKSVLVWIDDVLLFAQTPGAFLDNLEQFFSILRQRRLKLNAKKCRLFARRVKWCGKLIDGEGVEHDPARIAVLQKMPLPPTGAALQHLLCALNWLRDSMVDYARTVAPLQDKLESVMHERGRRKSQLSGVTLDWSDDEKVSFRRVLEMVSGSCKLIFPDKGATVNMFCDASLTGYSIVITQVRRWQDGLPIEQQSHELLVCRGGLFKNAQLNWSIVEKEGYPIVKACSDLDYMLVREKGFHIYCDHSNLIRLFSPATEVKQHVKGKLQRWVLKLVSCRYVIHHIAGENNLWADIISRWGQPAASSSGESVAVKRVATRSTQALSELRPLQDEQFTWPTQDEIVVAQRKHRRDAPPGASDGDGALKVDGRLWIPTKAKALVKRLLVIAHCGTQGHRGVHVMAELLDRHFELGNARQISTRFINDCLLCKHVKGGKVILRDWTVTHAVSSRNECIHMDYLFLGESYGDAKYVLVLKDELTHYAELVAADSANSQTAVEALLDWHKRFGLPRMWMSDNGAHFKCEVMAELAERLNATQAFAPVYTPWINGTVERVNRDILQVLRVMLLENQLDTRNWVHLLPLIQANLNHSPVLSLGGCAPVELFTGLPAPSALDFVMVPEDKLPRTLPLDKAEFREAIEDLRRSLHGLHRVVREQREQRRTAAMARSKGTVCNFSEGDYVLWSRVDQRLQGGKLLVRWVGPFQVVKALPHSFVIRHLITGVEYDVHGSRLKFYHDKDLNVTAEIREHVSLQGIVLEVRGIVGHRVNPASGELELHVAWRGLQDIENSWEPASSIMRDVPALVAKYAEDHNVGELQ